MRGLDGKTAIVTGAAGGIGGAVTERLIEEGCRVVAVDLTETALSQKLANLPADRLRLVAADVSLEGSAEAYVQAAADRFGGVDLFFNNAGIFGEFKPLVEMSVASFNQVIAVNLRGVFLGLQAVLRRMIEQGRGGAIVNTASTAAVRPSTMGAAYGSSKSAVAMLTGIAALENAAHDIRVNAVCPGFIDTPLLQGVTGGTAAAIAAAHHPMRRIGTPAEAASFVAYLLSDEASFHTGGVYTVDGALTLV